MHGCNNKSRSRKKREGRKEVDSEGGSKREGEAERERAWF